MSNIYDNWGRLVGAVIRREELWQMFHDRSPSVSSVSSDFSLDSEVPEGSSTVENLQIKEKSVEKEVSELVFVQGFSLVFDLEDMLKSTAQFLGKGTFGRSYMAAMDNGITVVLKRVNAVNISEKKFRQKMEVIGSVRHENVCALKAYYFSKDEKLMVYDHYSDGSVSAILHGKTGENQAPLDWETRLRIAVGAARGISHIHKQSGGKLVHGNIKSSNIFLNTEQYGCVSDLGLVSMIQSPVSRTAGYHAPEVKNTRNASQASDVYSFGVLLLELLTRKSPLHAISTGDEFVDLVKLVNSVTVKERTVNVFDVELLKNRNIEEQMVKMLEIGMSCVAKTPRRRPKMDQVVKMMEVLIRKMMVDNITTVMIKPKLVFLKGHNLKFDLGDMLGASAEVLGKGTFGTSYKAILENGFTVVVKRSKDVFLTIENFQIQMEVIGRMRNESVATIMAYYYSRDEKLKVSVYFDAGSVSSMLHRIFGKSKISLDWKTRLRIAVGAARGIAHIHKQLGQNLVHGKVKTSNIFLTAQGHGCVLEVGLATLMNTTSVLHGQSSGYRAPEATDTKKLSQASDIYSFGVVLLELVTGKPAIFSDDNEKAIQLVHWVASVPREDWIAEVIDLELLRYQNIEGAVVKVLQIALDCVKSVPNHRPKMSELTRIEDVNGMNFGAIAQTSTPSPTPTSPQDKVQAHIQSDIDGMGLGLGNCMQNTLADFPSPNEASSSGSRTPHVPSVTTLAATHTKPILRSEAPAFRPSHGTWVGDPLRYEAPTFNPSSSGPSPGRSFFTRRDHSPLSERDRSPFNDPDLDPNYSEFYDRFQPRRSRQRTRFMYHSEQNMRIMPHEYH